MRGPETQIQTLHLQSSSTSPQRPDREASSSFQELGVTPPLGFFDPLGLSKYDNDEAPRVWRVAFKVLGWGVGCRVATLKIMHSGGVYQSLENQTQQRLQLRSNTRHSVSSTRGN